MVNAPGRFFLCVGMIALGLLAAPKAAADVSAADAVGRTPAGDPVRSALREQRYPWYDAPSERVVPVLSRPDLQAPDLPKLRLPWVPGLGSLGEWLAIGITLLILTVVIVGLLELLRRYRPIGQDLEGAVAIRTGSAHRIEGLPAGVRFDASDPWAEAQRRREAGDYAGAVVYLFAHQLLTLERLRQVRLIPGRTGRQLVRGVPDRALRALVDPTLQLFELVYYGHRVPTREAFEVVWASTASFQRRVAETAASAVAGVSS